MRASKHRDIEQKGREAKKRTFFVALLERRHLVVAKTLKTEPDVGVLDAVLLFDVNVLEKELDEDCRKRP